MVFSSEIFLFGFLPIVLLGTFLLRKHLSVWNIFLLFMSLVFYLWGEPKYLILILLSIVINWSIAMLMDGMKAKRAKDILLVLAIFFNVGILFIFKYLNWGIGIYNSVLEKNVSMLSITLPVGISFYTFQALSYVIDVWRGHILAQKSLVKLGLYISLFPQLVAGPIVRYVDIEKEINSRRITAESFCVGIERFVIGLSKKVLLADSFAVVADKAVLLNGDNSLGTACAWLGAIAYSLQIYFDFSGYSDMAIGLGKMLGFTFGENFNYPYMATSVTDFWRRWHISLSSWFRDYVYIPLGGNRKGNIKTVINLAITWMATGIWHGANTTFLLWGGLYGCMIILEKLFSIPKVIEEKRLTRMFYRAFTLVMVAVCWVIFRAENVSVAWNYIKAMFSMQFSYEDLSIAGLYLREYIVAFVAGIWFAMPIGMKVAKRDNDPSPVAWTRQTKGILSFS